MKVRWELPALHHQAGDIEDVTDQAQADMLIAAGLVVAVTEDEEPAPAPAPDAEV